MNERSIFLAMIDLPATDRGAYLDRICAGDAELRAKVETLLAAHEKSGNFLNAPADPNRTLDTPDANGNFDHDNDLSFLLPPAKPGSLGRLAHYEIQETLGRGGFGIVFKAFDEKLHRIVAIKVMAPHLAATSPPRKRFLREARAAAAIKHENVVAIFAVEEQPIPYMVMEFVSGSSLQQHIDRTGPLDLPEILRYSKQIALGLEAAHANGLIHRDIKPGNILLEAGPEPKVKITDFGLARAADDASLTQSGTILGTPMYMSPEQAAGKPVDPRSDLFSLGSVMYVMASGRPPFRADSTLAVLKRVAEDTPRPIQQIVPDVPDWLCDVINKLHEKDPADRFESAKDVANAVDMAEANRLPRAMKKVAPAKAKSSSRTILLVLLVLFLVGGCAVSVVLIPALGWFFYADTGRSQSNRPKDNQSAEQTGVTKVDPAAILKGATLEGEEFLELPKGNTPTEKIVYYKAPFASTPYLTFPNGMTYGYVVSEQKAGSFKLTRAVPKEDIPPELKPGPVRIGRVPPGEIYGEVKLKWKAEGLPVLTPTLTNKDPGLADPDEKAKAPRAKPAFINKLGMAFALVPKGKAWLGGGGGKAGNTTIEIKDDFYMGVYEVTQKEWEDVMEKNPSSFTRIGLHKELVKDVPNGDLEHFPVECVSWNDCQEFITRLNAKAEESGWMYRLPTEQEWEYACRGGPMPDDEKAEVRIRSYFANVPSDSEPIGLANYGRVKAAKPFPDPVGSYKPNPLGLFDMHGNASELCVNSKRELPEETHLTKGGSWKDAAEMLQASKANYYRNNPMLEGSIGFRVVRCRE